MPKLEALTGKIALHYVKGFKRQVAEYLEEVDAWYRSGDGRSTRKGGKGYAFPYCFHGSSQWTDYDNICWRCEEGYSPHMTDWMYREALAMAKLDVAKMETRLAWLNKAPDGIPMEISSQILQWALETLKGKI